MFGPSISLVNFGHSHTFNMTFVSTMVLDVPVNKTFSPDENNEYKAH